MLDKIEQVFAAIVLALSVTALVVAAYGDESRRRNNARMDPTRGVLTIVGGDAGVGDGGDAAMDAAADATADAAATDGGYYNDAGFACYRVSSFTGFMPPPDLYFLDPCSSFTWLPGALYNSTTDPYFQEEVMYCTACNTMDGGIPSASALVCTRGDTPVIMGYETLSCRTNLYDGGVAYDASLEGYLTHEAIGFEAVGN